MNSRSFSKSLFICSLALALCPGSVQSGPKQVRIATVVDGPGEAYKLLATEMKKEIGALLAGEFEVSYPAKAQIVADWTDQNVSAGLDKVLADPDVDLVLAIGVLASDEACRREELAKPVVAPLVLDAKLQELPLQKGHSGRKNLNYLATPWALERDLKVFSEIYPFKKLAILVNKYLLEKVEKVHDKAKAREYIQKHAKDYVVVPVGQSAKEALAAIPKDADAVYLQPLLQMPMTEFDKLAAGFIQRKLPSFSVAGRVHVERGILAGLRPPSDITRLARQVAVNVHRILLGEDAGTLPVAFSPGARLTINVKTSKSIGTSPPFRVLIDAELLDSETAEKARMLSLNQVIQEALDANLELAMAHQDVLVGALEQKKARANLLPGLSLGTTATLIDSDRAEASFGTQPGFSWTASVTLQEVLAEGAFANLEIQKHLQTARIHQEDQIRLDIIEAAVVAYLNVLRAGIAERIQKNNVQLSRTNLDLAQKRLAIGATRTSEVYRWEAEIARQRQAVVNSHLNHSLAELELNRLLRRPLEEEFCLKEIELIKMLLAGKKRNLHKTVDNPNAMRAFRDYLVIQARKASPELAQLNQSMKAVRRQIASIRRSFWMPALALQGQVNQRLAEAGAGLGELTLPPDMAAMADMFPSQDDTNWHIGLSLNWQLFEGGLRFAEIDQARAELARLETRHQRIEQLVEQRVRAALQNGRASSANMVLSNIAARAASKNLKLVTDAYSRGALTILELLDAQNAALVSDLARTNSEFTFAIDMVRAQRAAGGFFITLDPDARDAWIGQFEEYLKNHSE